MSQRTWRDHIADLDHDERGRLLEALIEGHIEPYRMGQPTSLWQFFGGHPIQSEAIVCGTTGSPLIERNAKRQQAEIPIFTKTSRDYILDLGHDDARRLLLAVLEGKQQETAQPETLEARLTLLEKKHNEVCVTGKKTVEWMQELGTKMAEGVAELGKKVDSQAKDNYPWCPYCEQYHHEDAGKDKDFGCEDPKWAF